MEDGEQEREQPPGKYNLSLTEWINLEPYHLPK
jgi:hypothetical protein